MRLSFLLSPSFASRSRYVPLFLLVLWLQSFPALAQAPRTAEPAVERVMNTMLGAIQNNSLRDFSAAGDPAFQSGMTQETLDSVRQVLASRLAQGYTSTFLASLKQQGFTIYLWKLEFKDNNDDVLVTIAMQNGRVGGFWLR